LGGHIDSGGLEVTQIERADTALRLAIVRRGFTVRRRGYDPVEVDDLLDTVTELADDLLLEAAAGARHQAEAEAELVRARAEVRELREGAAAAEHVLATTRARVLQASSHDTGRALRAAVDEAHRSLGDARQELEWERAALVTVEGQLADVQRQLAALAAERSTDPFDRVGAEVAGLLRSAAEAADAVRAQSESAARAVLAEAEELAAAVLKDAEAEARRTIEAAGHAATGPDGEAVIDLRRFAMDANGAEGGS